MITDILSYNQIKNSEVSDSCLWEKLKEGNEIALGQIYERYVEELFSYGLNQNRDREYVMDCIHDVFLDVYKYRDNLSPTDNIKYYLYKCLKRRIHKKKSPKVISLNPDNRFLVERKMSSISSEEEIINFEIAFNKKKRLADALKLLPKRQRECVLMRFTKDISYEEIATTMNVSVQSARTIVYRGLKSLRKSSIMILLVTQAFLF